MNDEEYILLTDFSSGKISADHFIKAFPIDIVTNTEYVISEVEKAIGGGNTEELEVAINLIWLSGNFSRYIDLLNKLLVTTTHRSHQAIALELQHIGHPSSIVYIRKVLESNFSYLNYTASDSEVIAKWLSWVLYAIGTKEAIDLMLEYANSPDSGISSAMQYRLKKVESKKE